MSASSRTQAVTAATFSAVFSVTTAPDAAGVLIRCRMPFCKSLLERDSRWFLPRNDKPVTALIFANDSTPLLLLSMFRNILGRYAVLKL